MAVSAHILKMVEKDPFLRLQMRRKEDSNRHQFFSINKQYVKIINLCKMRQIVGVLFDKCEILVKL